MKLQQDIQEYIAASDRYAEVCKQSGESGDEYKYLFQARQHAHQDKVTAAENLIMSVLGLYPSALAAIGLKDLYMELQYKTERITLLFNIADETARNLKK